MHRIQQLKLALGTRLRNVQPLFSLGRVLVFYRVQVALRRVILVAEAGFLVKLIMGGLNRVLRIPVEAHVKLSFYGLPEGLTLSDERLRTHYVKDARQRYVVPVHILQDLVQVF